MLSSVLRSRRAVEVNISIMRAFAVRIYAAFARAGAGEEKSDWFYCLQRVKREFRLVPKNGHPAQ
jgi:hypothetical protein